MSTPSCPDDLPHPALVAAWWVVGECPTGRLPWWAAEWLIRGWDGESLRMLAGLNGRDAGEVHDLLPTVFAELPVVVPSLPLAEAEMTFALLAREFLTGADSVEGADRVVQMVGEFVVAADHDPEISVLPLGRLAVEAEIRWASGGDPPGPALIDTVRTACLAQLRMTDPG